MLPTLLLLALKLHLSPKQDLDSTCFPVTCKYLGTCLSDMFWSRYSSMHRAALLVASESLLYRLALVFPSCTLSGSFPPRFLLTALWLDWLRSFQPRLNAIKRSLTTWRGSRVANDGRILRSKMQGGSYNQVRNRFQ